jgi:arsenate reductase
MSKHRVIFLSTGNSARSQMAEAFLRKYGEDRFEVHSAGVADAKDLDPLAIQAMKEVGIDLSGQRSKEATEYLGKALFEYMITVSAEAEENSPTAWPGVDLKMHWYFENPAEFVGSDEEKLAKFREVRDQIEHKVREWLETLPTDEAS